MREAGKQRRQTEDRERSSRKLKEKNGESGSPSWCFYLHRPRAPNYNHPNETPPPTLTPNPHTHWIPAFSWF